MSSKDIGAFIHHFVNKCVQVIVQSRLGTERTQTKCDPHSKEWFNLDIKEEKDVAEQTDKCLKLIAAQSSGSSLYFVKNNWQICCEISLRNSDGSNLILEYWIFSNIALTNAPEHADAKPNQHMYQTLNRMSTLIKSLITLTRATPAYKLSAKGQSADSYVICYRVFQCNDFLTDIMDSVGNNQFSQMKLLGTIITSYNELSIQLLYRTSMNIDTDSKILVHTKEEEDNICDNNELMLSLKDDHFKPDDTDDDKFDVMEIFKPLNPAFATKQKNDVDAYSNSTPFSALLPQDEDSSDSMREISTHLSKDTTTKTAPISIQSPPKSKSPQVYSTSSDSFVFVELNAPFASDEREFGPFFHGPSPTFISHSDDSNDINELSLQLAELESNAPQFDSFIESITESEELKFES